MERKGCCPPQAACCSGQALSDLIRLFQLFQIIALCVVPVVRCEAQALPPDATFESKTIGEWSAEWLKWAVIIPAAQSPFFDPTGEFAAVGQPDAPVFFLGFGLGFAPGTITRQIEIPEGKYLFLPLEFYEADNFNTIPPLRVTELRDQAVGIIKDPLELHANLDGKAIPDLLSHRAVSPIFSLYYTNSDNLHAAAYGQPVIGLVDPVVLDGYWLMLEPLSPGAHVLNYGGTLTNQTFATTDLLVYITVKPRPPGKILDELISKLRQSSLPTKAQTPLLASLDAAKASFNDGKTLAGVNQLQAFQNKMRAQVGSEYDALAAALLSLAQTAVEHAQAKSSN
jgi:hypothetical protein